MRYDPRKLVITAFLAGTVFFFIGRTEAAGPRPGTARACPGSVTKTVLDNGLTVILSENRANPVVSVLITVGAGLSSEGNYCGTGISHFVEHMIFKGTGKRKPGEIETEVKSYGGSINAATGLDSTSYYITVPKKHAYSALELMEDIVFHPAFRASEIERERDVIFKEIRLTRDDPTRRVMRQLWRTAYLEHPYKMPIIGYEDLFGGLEREDLVRYHSERYVPNNAILTVVGDFEKEDMLERINELFLEAERGRNPDVAVPAESEQNASRVASEPMPINLGYLAMGYHTVELTDTDLYALDVLAIILGDWDGSRLNKKLVKEDELLYTVSAYNYTPKYPGLFIVYGVTDAQKMQQAKEAVLSEIKRIKESGIEGPELETARNLVISGYINTLETTGGLANSISHGEFLAGDPSFFQKYTDGVKKVDGEVIRKVANKYLNENNLTVSFLCPVEKGAKPGGAPPPGAEAGRPVFSVLPNGMRLVMKEDHRLPKIALVSVFPGGLRAETGEKNGISSLMAAMLLKGTKNRKEDRIRPVVESMGGSISAFSGMNTFGLSMTFLSEYENEVLDIFADVIQDPVFPEDELEKEKKKVYAAIKNQDDDVYATGFLKLRKGLFEDYPYGMRVIGEKGTVEALTPGDLEDFHGKYCAAENAVIAVVGDFDSGDMRRGIERRLSGMRKEAAEINPRRPAPLKAGKKLDFQMPRRQSLVVLGFRGASFEDRERYALDILSSILSGENGRLYQTVRNRLGMAYALGSFSTPGIDTGYLAAYVATDLEHMREARKALIEELEAVKNGDIREEEISLARNELIGRQEISLQAMASLAYRMALDEIYGAGYDAYLDYPETISSIEADEITAAAAKYLDFEGFVSVDISGTEK